MTRSLTERSRFGALRHRLLASAVLANLSSTSVTGVRSTSPRERQHWYALVVVSGPIARREGLTGSPTGNGTHPPRRLAAAGQLFRGGQRRLFGGIGGPLDRSRYPAALTGLRRPRRPRCRRLGRTSSCPRDTFPRRPEVRPTNATTAPPCGDLGNDADDREGDLDLVPHRSILRATEPGRCNGRS